MIPFITVLSGSQAAQAGRLDAWQLGSASGRETAASGPMPGQAPQEPAMAWSRAQESFEES